MIKILNILYNDIVIYNCMTNIVKFAEIICIGVKDLMMKDNNLTTYF